MKTTNQTHNNSKRGLKFILMLFTVVFFTTTVSTQIIFENGFENGNAEWDGDPWKVHQLGPIPTNTNREGNKSARFTGNPDLSKKRREITIAHGDGIYEWGQEYWVGFSMMVKQEVLGYRIVFQHHGSPKHNIHPVTGEKCGAAPNHFTITTENGKFKLWNSTKEEEALEIHPGGALQAAFQEITYVSYVEDQWHDFVLHFKYEYTNSGYFQAWIDGEKVIDKTGVTAYKIDECGNEKKYAFQKIGIYHGPDSNVGEILYDAFRIGKGNLSYEDVAPAAGTLATTEFQETIDVTIYPNPTANEMSIQFPEVISIETVSIYDILGKEVFIKKIVSTENELFLIPNLSTGIYIIKINTTEKGLISKKIIIE